MEVSQHVTMVSTRSGTKTSAGRINKTELKSRTPHLTNTLSACSITHSQLRQTGLTFCSTIRTEMRSRRKPCRPPRVPPPPSAASAITRYGGCYVSTGQSLIGGRDPFDFSLYGVAHRPSDFASAPNHHPPVSEEQDATFIAHRQVRHQRRLRCQDEESVLP